MTGVSTLGQALDQISRLKELQLNFTSLSTQLATGKKTQKFSGLGTDLLTSKRARADFKSLDTYINNITNAERRVSVAVTAIQEFKTQANTLLSAMSNLSQQSTHQDGEIVYYDDPATTDVVENIPIGMTSADSDIDLENLQSLAGNLFSFMGELLNVQDGNRYLLAGSASDQQPYTDTGSLDAAITNLFDDWRGTAITNDQFISGLQTRDAADDPNAITDSLVGYSPSLSSGNTKNVYVRVDDTAEIDITALANAQPFRDVMVALAYLKSDSMAPIADVYAPPNAGPPALPDIEGAPGADMDEQKNNFFAVYDAMLTTFSEAVKDVDSVLFSLQNSQARIQQIKETHEQEKNLLLDTISQVENVDVNEVAVKINSLQIQLEASFRVAARVQELSLVNFI